MEIGYIARDGMYVNQLKQLELSLESGYPGVCPVFPKKPVVIPYKGESYRVSSIELSRDSTKKEKESSYQYKPKERKIEKKEVFQKTSSIDILV